MSKISKITVSEFVKEYNTMNQSSKRDYVQSVITSTYCPILFKRTVLQDMLDKSVVTTIDGNEYVDMLTHRLNTVGFIIGTYTNLTFDFDENGKPQAMDAYDLLHQSGALEQIYECIGERELQEINLVNKDLLDTWYNRHNMEAFVSAQVTRLGTLVGSLSEGALIKLSETITDENKTGKLLSKINDLLNK